MPCSLAPLPRLPPKPAAVFNCSQLNATVAAIRLDARGLKKGTKRFTIDLACGAGADFSDCGSPGDGDGGGAASAPGLPPALLVIDSRRAHLTVRADPATCGAGAGAQRPVIGSRTASGARLVAAGSGASLTLDGLAIDGGGGRPCVAFSGGGVLTMTNVVVTGCASAGDGAGLLVTGAARVVVTGGAFEGCAAAGDGGAISAEIGDSDGRPPGAPRPGALAIRGVKFSGNTAARGGAIAVVKAAPGAASVACAGCEFRQNCAAAGCGAAVEARRRDAAAGGRPGGPLALDLTGSSFEGEPGGRAARASGPRRAGRALPLCRPCTRRCACSPVSRPPRPPSALLCCLPLPSPS